MLNFINLQLARDYLLFAFLAQTGVLQIIAARRRLVGLSFINYARRPFLGYILGALLILGSYVWFFATHEAIFQPGPAGSELTFLFAAAGVLAITLALAVAELSRLGRERSARDLTLISGEGEPVLFDVAQGFLYLPEKTDLPAPMVCILPGPLEKRSVLQQFKRALLDVGVGVLIVDLISNFPGYPEVLAVVPRAVSFLTNHPRCDAKRIALLGTDLGGNVALRSASMDERIKCVVGVGVLLGRASTKPGLNILREMTYMQALSWSRFRDRDKLISGLAAADYMTQGVIGGRTEILPKKLLWGELDALAPAEERAMLDGGANGALELDVRADETHTTLVENVETSRLVAKWLAERLAHDA